MNIKDAVIACAIASPIVGLVAVQLVAEAHEADPTECPPCPCASPEEVAIALEAIRASVEVAAEAEAADAELVADSEAGGE